MMIPHDLLQEKICLVTGGAQGIGWATAQAMAAHGGKVFVCDVSEENLKNAAGELATLPWADQIKLSYCDVAQRAQMEEWLTQIYRQTGRIDVLANNAAYVRWTNVCEMSVDDAERMMTVGYNAMIYSIKTVLPWMEAAGSGHIINMGSSAGHIFVGGASAAYAAVKAAIEAYTLTLQIELQHSPVAVTLVRPATVAGTDFFRKHVSASRLPRLTDFIPYLTPPDVAAGILFAIRDRRFILDLPGYLAFFNLFYALAPGMLRWLTAVSGTGRRQYGEIEWRYWQAEDKDQVSA